MLIIWPIQSEILIGLWTYKFLTAQQAQKLSKNRHLQSIYVELRVLKEKDMIGTIVYWGVSKTGDFIGGTALWKQWYSKREQ